MAAMTTLSASSPAATLAARIDLEALPGSTDSCLIVRTPIEGALRRLQEHGIEPEQGPSCRVDETGRLLSVPVRVSDGTVVELANRLED